MGDTPSSDTADDEPERRSADLVDIVVGRLRLDSEVADWVSARLRRHEVNGWGGPEAIADLLTVAHHREAAHQETRDDRQAGIHAVAETLAARTP
ncbi:hypothetical protein BJ973_004006 [Actinoplanes tereljensis]|uniref:Uncharacterized protein n=1 Tax=Paractinoplanes tereljensis TaxID=571912 RepID=A0A919TX06_9ACTN|nr:hypothetical protein [Actinoplanes tereljensis]GIF25731.1 hypothetical protein Ate02nite_84610 [Actinoplanes tereljensis]